MAQRWSLNEDYIVCKYCVENRWAFTSDVDIEQIQLKLERAGFSNRSARAIKTRARNYDYLIGEYVESPCMTTQEREVLDIVYSGKQLSHCIDRYVEEVFRPNDSVDDSGYTLDDKRSDMHQYLAIGEVEMKPSFYDILDELLEKYYAKHEKDGKTISFQYDENGLRHRKTITENGVITEQYDYVWSDGSLISQTYTSYTDGVATSDTARFIYDSWGTLQGFILNDSETYLYVKNLQGDIIAIVDELGEVIVEYSYDAWGNVTFHETSLQNMTKASTLCFVSPFTYRGYCYDYDIELYYLQSRYYSAEIGRFINTDDTQIAIATQGEVLGANLFAYCNNNPVMNVDTNGFVVLSSALLVAIGAAVGFVTSFILSVVISRATNPKISARELWVGALIDGLMGAISGAFAVLPCGKIIQAIINGLIAGASYIAYCKLLKKPVYRNDLISSVVIGAISGFAGGNGVLKKVKGKINISEAIKYTNKVISRESNRKNIKYATKMINAAKDWLANLVGQAMWKTFSKYSIIFGFAKYVSNKL